MSYGGGNPQLEDGFARIANEILDAIARTSLSDYEARCIHFLWRMTYGWTNGKGKAKKSDAISYSQWSNATRIPRSNVITSLRHLQNRQIVVKSEIRRAGRNTIIVWSFQKKYQLWNGYKPVAPDTPVEIEPVCEQQPLTIQPVASDIPDRIKVVAQNSKVVAPDIPEVVAPDIPTIDNIDTTTIDNNPSSTKKADLFNESVKKIFEELKKRRRIPSPQATAEAVAIRWMLKYGFTVEQILEAYDKLKEKEFWADKLLNMQSVKAQISELINSKHKGKFSAGRRPGRVPTKEDLDRQAREKGVL